MTNVRLERGADSPLVERISSVVYDVPTRELSTPDGCWDIVVIQKRGVTTVLQTGVLTHPFPLDNEPGDSFLAISFKPGVFVPNAPGHRMVDTALVRPLVSSRAFALDGDTLEIPTFENAEGLVRRMVGAGMLRRDELVESAVEGHPRAISPRSIQRHFLHATGLSQKQFAQIRRARHAVDLLRRGMAPAAVAVEAGFADQPHLTRSLKAIMGQTPGELLRVPR